MEILLHKSEKPKKEILVIFVRIIMEILLHKSKKQQKSKPLLFLLDISTSSEKPDYASLINKPTENSLKQHAHKEKI